jgi:uncharacterized protein DUF3187
MRRVELRRIAAGLFLALLALAVLSPAAASAELPEVETAPPPPPPPEEPWFHLGALRIRDLTPFGILRLDFLPAHAVTARPGTWAFEVNLSYQNTYVLSQNVQDYLEVKGGGHRVYLDDTDVAHFVGQPEEAYFLDGELGLFDLTAHYRFTHHWGAYVTVPYLMFQNGFLDATIEGFHDLAGLDQEGRDLVERDRFFVLSKTNTGTVVQEEPPKDGFADPVVGVRYTLFPKPEKWNMVFEGAAKIAFRDAQVFVSSGESDYGLQVSYQRFFSKQALYFTASGIQFNGVDLPGFSTDSDLIPTAVGAWEFRMSPKVNGIVQLYASPSVVKDSALEELSANKYLGSLGVQVHTNDGWLYRFALTENLVNFLNTADIAATLSIAKAFRLPQP